MARLFPYHVTRHRVLRVIWVCGLQAPEGQQINVTLMDFTGAVQSPAGGRRRGGEAAWCPVIVRLRELGTSAAAAAAAADGATLLEATPRETVVRACDSRVRKRLIYTSRTNKLRVIMPLATAGTATAARPSQPVRGHYLLYFQGIQSSVFMFRHASILVLLVSLITFYDNSREFALVMAPVMRCRQIS